MRKHISLLISALFALSFFFVACPSSNSSVVVKSVSVSPATLELWMGDTGQLTARIDPADASNKDVTWSSGDDDTASVSNTGLVLGRAIGETSITATTADGKKTSSCIVTVSEFIPASGLTLDQTTLFVTVNGTEQLTATVSPEHASVQTVSWKSNDIGTATVSASGVVTGVALGNTVITATTMDGTNISKTCTVTVTGYAAATGITINQATLALDEGFGGALTATIAPSYVSNKSVTWASSNHAIATVSNSGFVTGHAVGTADITATTHNDITSSSCKVTVTQGPDVWIGGSVFDGWDFYPAIWKNGVLDDNYLTLNQLYDSTWGEIYCLWVSNSGVVHAGGTIQDTLDLFGEFGWKEFPFWWRGKTSTRLINDRSVTESIVLSMHGSGEDVFLGGYTYNGGPLSAIVWRNAERQTITTNANAAVRGVYATGANSYVACGQDRDNAESTINRPCLWVNGTQSPPAWWAGTWGIVYSVSQVGSTRHAVGRAALMGETNWRAAYWNGDNLSFLPTPEGAVASTAQSVFEAGGTVYICGMCRIGSRDVAVVWIGPNNQPIRLNATGNALTNGIFVLNGVVYVVGGFDQKDHHNGWMYYTTPTIWRNGVPHALSLVGIPTPAKAPTNVAAHVRCVYVKSRQ